MNQNKSSEQQKPTSYEALSNYEVDKLIAKRVMGWASKLQSTGPFSLHRKWWVSSDGCAYDPDDFRPSSDDNYARAVRNRIAELGLSYVFLEELDRVLHLPEHGIMLKHPTFDLMQAPARFQAIAALRALDASKEKPNV